MSETPRIYSTSGAGFSLVRHRRSQRLRRGILIACAVALAYSFWISRDTHPIAEFVQADRALEIVIPRANAARHRLAESRIWDGVPESWVAGWPNAMADTRGLPEWVVGNLVGSGAIAVADDITGWTDLVVASKMTRAGCVIERALRFMPSNSGEWAGGLQIRFWKAGALHYAVRGRTLLLSPSRDALVDALTVAKDRRLPADSVRNALADAGAEDARGTYVFPEDSELGRVFSDIRFAVRLEAGEATVRFRATFRPDVAEDLAPAWGGSEPKALAPPFEAPITLSADLGTNVEETWHAVSDLIDAPWLNTEQWELWREEDPERSPAAILTALLGSMGTGMRVAWLGTDLGEMAPTPILVGSLDGSQESVEAVLHSLPERSDEQRADADVYFDRQTHEVDAELMSGPSMHPRGRWYGDTLFFSTSQTEAAAFLEDGRHRTLAAPRAANVFVAVDPLSAIEEIVEVGEGLARDGLLRDFAPEEFNEQSAIWIERAATLETAHLLASVNNKHIEAELYVKCAPAAEND